MNDHLKPFPRLKPMKPAPQGQAGVKRFFMIAVSSAIMTGALLFSAACAQAQERSDVGGDWQVTIGAGAIYAPDYEGSKDHEIVPFPLLSVGYKDIVYIRGPEIGINVLRFSPAENVKIKLGAIVRYRRDRPVSRNAALTGLGDVDTAIELGGAARAEVGRGWLQISVAKDVAGGHDGIVAQGEAGFDYDLADRLTLSLSGTTSWVDRKYMATYFSITPSQSARSGLPEFSAGKGFKDVGASANISYRLSDHWLVATTASYSRLLDDVERAPLVRRRGSADQWQAGIFLAYHF